MGMFDEIRCEMPLPDNRAFDRTAFQTKSLWRSMDRFTITADGRLIYHKRRFRPYSSTMPERIVHVEDVDLDFHGDIEIHGQALDGTLGHFVVRFTHGTLESVRPFVELPEIHRLWLMERGT